MAREGSVSRWIDKLKIGDSAAAEELWKRYFDSLVRLARQKLAGARRGMADEEDVALSAFKSLCMGLREGRFSDLADRDSLWRLLVVITARKACDQRMHEQRQKRGTGKVHGQASGHRSAESSEPGLDIEQLISGEPTPEFAVLMDEQCERLLEALGSDELRSVALWKMEGYTNDEIAAKLGCVTRSVERKISLIRKKWVHASSA